MRILYVLENLSFNINKNILSEQFYCLDALDV
jgi:hypothetical protein